MFGCSMCFPGKTEAVFPGKHIFHVSAIFLNVGEEAACRYGAETGASVCPFHDTVGMGVVENMEGHEVNLTSITWGNGRYAA